MSEQAPLFDISEVKARIKGKKKKSKSEENEQLKLCNYVKRKYPLVLFFSDVASGLHLPIWIAALHKKLRSGRGIPDTFFAVAKNGYHGLFIELKRTGTELKRKSNGKKINKGDYRIRMAGDWTDVHVEEQAAVLDHLRKEGFRAEFAVGYDEAVKLIDEYMK